MNPARFILIAMVRVYQWIVSPVLPLLVGTSSFCRFQPTCSQYAIEAFQEHGARKGVCLAVKRLCRCHPWGDAGIDLVPGRQSNAESLFHGP